MRRDAGLLFLPAVLVLLTGCASVDATPATSPAPSPATPLATGSDSGETAWVRLDDAPFARLEMGVAAHEDRIWLAGGLSPFGDALTDVDVFDPATGAWSDGPPLPAGLHHASLVSTGDRLLLIGGYRGSSFGTPVDLVLELTADGWVAGPSLPEPRAAGAAAWDGERVVYAGGVGTGVSPDVFALTGTTWTKIGVLSAPREHLAATSDGAGRTWLLGGRVGGLDTNVATVESVVGDSIETHPALSVPRGGVAAFFLPPTGACLTGGEAPDRAHTQVECTDEGGGLVALPDMGAPHHGHGAAVVSGRAYVMLGGPEPGLSAGAVVERLDLGSGAD